MFYYMGRVGKVIVTNIFQSEKDLENLLISVLI